MLKQARKKEKKKSRLKKDIGEQRPERLEQARETITRQTKRAGVAWESLRRKRQQEKT